MRFCLAVTVLLIGVGASGLAQKNTYDAKPSNPLKVKQSAPLPAGKTAGAGSSSAANAKDLQGVERQAAAKPRASSTGASKASSASKLTPVKEKSNPPINFGATGGAKSSGLTNQGSDPYKGRVKQRKHQ